MKLQLRILEWVNLILTVILPGLLVAASLPLAAEEITNSASASGDNLQTTTSNQTSLTTGTVLLELIKTADRAAAEPGDTVIYRLGLKNKGSAVAKNIILTDILPLGLRFIPNSLQGEVVSNVGTTRVTLPPATTDKRNITFTYPNLAPQQSLNVVYAAIVTPDAIRGSGRNQAQESRSNIASHLLRIRPGILSDCGTIVGRVFIDKNFDGEQQPGEAGVPNSVIYMDDGNRIVTDANGLFSLANAIAGDRTGTLDLTSIPGYTLAQNQKFIERNSQSRLVRLAPGGLVRMNFAVTPLSQ